jgi:hypothetical protein
MAWRIWSKLAELATELVDEAVSFWKEDVWPLFMGFSFFFFLAVPLLIVLGILWYLDSIDWKPEHGRYKVGLESSCRACTTSASFTSAGRLSKGESADTSPASSAAIV